MRRGRLHPAFSRGQEVLFCVPLLIFGVATGDFGHHPESAAEATTSPDKVSWRALRSAFPSYVARPIISFRRSKFSRPIGSSRRLMRRSISTTASLHGVEM